jgi:cytochrome c553
MMRVALAAGLAVIVVACGPTTPEGETPGAIATAGTGGASDEPRSFGFGSPATGTQIAAWDIDVGPDGAGLPAGEARVSDGLAVYAAKCATCHGPDGTGGPNDALAGRIPGDAFPFATDATATYTVGSYWPYATTLFDYVRKAMPFDAPGSLTDIEVYGAVGAVLHFNELLTADALVDSATIADLRMPSRDRFVRDDREGGPVVR